MIPVAVRAGTLSRRAGSRPAGAPVAVVRLLVLSMGLAGCASPPPTHRAGDLYVSPPAPPQPPPTTADDPNGGAD